MDINERVNREFMGDEAYEKHVARVKLQENQFARLAHARDLDSHGHLKEAVYMYEQLVHEGIEHAQAYLRLAVIFRKQKQYEDEIRVMEKALQVWRDFNWGDLENKGEKHFARDWPAEEIAATYRRMVKAPCARRDPSPEPDFPSMCLRVLEYAQRYFNLSRERAAWMLIEILRCEVAFETPGSRPS